MKDRSLLQAIHSGTGDLGGDAGSLARVYTFLRKVLVHADSLAEEQGHPGCAAD